MKSIISWHPPAFWVSCSYIVPLEAGRREQSQAGRGMGERPENLNLQQLRPRTRAGPSPASRRGSVPDAMESRMSQNRMNQNPPQIGETYYTLHIYDPRPGGGWELCGSSNKSAEDLLDAARSSIEANSKRTNTNFWQYKIVKEIVVFSGIYNSLKHLQSLKNGV